MYRHQLRGREQQSGGIHLVPPHQGHAEHGHDRCSPVVREQDSRSSHTNWTGYPPLNRRPCTQYQAVLLGDVTEVRRWGLLTPDSRRQRQHYHPSVAMNWALVNCRCERQHGLLNHYNMNTTRLYDRYRHWNHAGRRRSTTHTTVATSVGSMFPSWFQRPSCSPVPRQRLASVSLHWSPRCPTRPHPVPSQCSPSALYHRHIGWPAQCAAALRAVCGVLSAPHWANITPRPDTAAPPEPTTVEPPGTTSCPATAPGGRAARRAPTHNRGALQTVAARHCQFETYMARRCWKETGTRLGTTFQL